MVRTAPTQGHCGLQSTNTPPPHGAPHSHNGQQIRQKTPAAPWLSCIWRHPLVAAVGAQRVAAQRGTGRLAVYRKGRHSVATISLVEWPCSMEVVTVLGAPFGRHFPPRSAVPRWLLRSEFSIVSQNFGHYGQPCPSDELGASWCCVLSVMLFVRFRILKKIFDARC